MLKGYKTYILGTATIIGAAATYLVGDADLANTINLIVGSLMAMFIRDGINTAIKPK